MPAAGSQTVAFAIGGPIARADLPGLCARVCELLSASEGAPIVLCDVAGIAPDAVTIDALARLQLAARRHGCHVQLCNASESLLELVAFMGLEDVCGGDAPGARYTQPSNETETRAAGRRAGRGSSFPGRR